MRAGKPAGAGRDANQHVGREDESEAAYLCIFSIDGKVRVMRGRVYIHTHMHGVGM
jgi:hypothetical protein